MLNDTSSARLLRLLEFVNTENSRSAHHLEQPNGEATGTLPDWLSLVVAPLENQLRIDSLLAARLEGVSRSRVNTAIRRGLVQVDGRRVKPSERLPAGTLLHYQIPPPPPEGPIPEDVPLDILHQDDVLVVVNKPPGMVVHPAKGHWSGTLTAALAHHFRQLSGAGGPHRPGIVHRLDRDTSGVIAIACTDEAHAALTHQFQNRTVEKEYLAIVSPPPSRDQDRIDRSIGVHPWQREKMAVRDDEGSRSAVTRYEVTLRRGRFASVALFPETGRTHQLRVHLASIGSPVVADRLYSGRGWLKRSELTGNRADDDTLLTRQALHARRLSLRHPVSGKVMVFEAPVPPDLAQVLQLLQS